MTGAPLFVLLMTTAKLHKNPLAPFQFIASAIHTCPLLNLCIYFCPATTLINVNPEKELFAVKLNPAEDGAPECALLLSEISPGSQTGDAAGPFLATSPCSLFPVHKWDPCI